MQLITDWNIKLKWKNIILVFAVFNLMFSSYFYSTKLTNFLQAISLVAIAFIVFIDFLYKKRARILIESDFEKIFFSILFIAYISLVCISTYINRNNHTITNSTMSCIAYVIMLIFLYFGYDSILDENFIYNMNVLLFFIGMSCVINDILFFPHITEARISQNYLFSGKFAVAYMHLEWIAFYIFKQSINKIRSPRYKINVTLLSLYSLIICILVDCTTGIVGLILLIVIIFLISNKVVLNPFVWLISLISSYSFVIFYDKILSIGWIRYIIVDCLHRSITLTGRTFIYDQLPKILEGHYLWGYGFGSDYETWQIWGYRIANSQNAIVHLIIEQGTISVIVLIILCLFVLICAVHDKKIIPIVAMIYVLTFLGTVEITFTLNFVSLFLFVFLVSKKINNGFTKNLN